MLAPKFAGTLIKSLAPGEQSIDVERHLADPGLAAHLADRRAVLSLLEHERDLRLAELGPLYSLTPYSDPPSINGVFSAQNDPGSRIQDAGHTGSSTGS